MPEPCDGPDQQTITWSADAADVVAVFDAAGPFIMNGAGAFPTATPADWSVADRLDPGARGPDGG